uniref:Lipoprotein n=1 Tax=Heterorhabditis bacteriophora TaxID=37862 RepID=A0A1I7XIQ7_HETBA
MPIGVITQDTSCNLYSHKWTKNPSDTSLTQTLWVYRKPATDLTYATALTALIDKEGNNHKMKLSIN